MASKLDPSASLRSWPVQAIALKGIGAELHVRFKFFLHLAVGLATPQKPFRDRPQIGSNHWSSLLRPGSQSGRNGRSRALPPVRFFPHPFTPFPRKLVKFCPPVLFRFPPPRLPQSLPPN